MHSARRSVVRRARSASTKPGRLDDARRARARRSPRRTAAALGAVAEELAAQARDALARARATAGDHRRAPASRGSCRPANTHQRLGRRGPRRLAASRRTRPAAPSTSPRRPSARSRSRVQPRRSRTRAGARARTARCTAQPTRPPSAAEVLAPVARGSTPRASRRRARSRRSGRAAAPAASSEKYGNDAVCTTS